MSTDNVTLSTEYRPGVTLPIGTKLRMACNNGQLRTEDVVTLLRDDNTRNSPYLVQSDRVNVGQGWVDRDRVEIVQGQDHPTAASQKPQNVSLNRMTKAQLVERCERLEGQFKTLGQKLKEAAEEHDLCDDYEEFIEDVNKDLDIKLPSRIPVFTFRQGDVVTFNATHYKLAFLRGSEEWTDSQGVKYSDRDMLVDWSDDYTLIIRDSELYGDPQPGDEDA